MRYLKGTTSYGIFYRKGEEANLLAFIDSDYVGDEDDSKSTSGYVFLFSSRAYHEYQRSNQLLLFRAQRQNLSLLLVVHVKPYGQKEF